MLSLVSYTYNHIRILESRVEGRLVHIRFEDLLPQLSYLCHKEAAQGMQKYCVPFAGSLWFFMVL